MRIAYGILCHIDAPHICRLARKLTEGTENRVFVHVDRKSDIAPFRALLDGLERVTVLDTRVDVRWAGYAAVEATVALMRAAIESGDCQRFQLLQGLEYPLMSNREIDAFYEAHRGIEFMKGRAISHINVVSEIQKYRLLWMWDQNTNPFFWCWNKANMVLLRLKCIPHFKKNYVLDSQGRKMDIYEGSAQWAVTMEAAKMIVDFHDRNPGFNRYFRSVYAVDEAYFHTILYNSEFASRTLCGGSSEGTCLGDFMNLTYCLYQEEVRLFTKASDWEFLRSTGFMFFRKAGSQSGELLDYIDRVHEGETHAC